MSLFVATCEFPYSPLVVFLSEIDPKKAGDMSEEGGKMTTVLFVSS